MISIQSQGYISLDQGSRSASQSLQNLNSAIYNFSWEDEWITQCNQTERNSCDIVSPILSLDRKCARHSGEYEGKVRACVSAPNGTTKCSSWIFEMFEIPSAGTEFPFAIEWAVLIFINSADQFTAPDFSIDGVYHGTQLRISNRPFVVRHSNISLNCYYRGHLVYKILYWVGNDKNNSIQVRLFHAITRWIHSFIDFITRVQNALVRWGYKL